MAKDKANDTTIDKELPVQWLFYLLFLFGIAMLYIYLTHRTDNLVRDIESTKKNLVELRAENITLKSELIKNRSRENMEAELKDKNVKEPNRAIKLLKEEQGD